MAANYVPVTPALAELISSLPQDEVPIRLRCAICSKLAVNAFRLPCCEQMICETCHSSLPSACPVCEHTPLSADDCKPAKALRMTTKAFLKTEEKKRGNSRVKEKDARDMTPITPVDANPPAAPTVAHTAPSAPVVDETVATEPASEQTAQMDDPAEDTVAKATTEEGQEAPPQLDNEVPSDEQVSEEVENAEDKQVVVHQGATETEGDNEAQPKESNEDDENVTDVQPNTNANASFPGGFGFGGMNGAFPNVNYGGGDLTQMQMMMAMQNGMAPNAFGAFPMMGMPGMAAMDPSMMNMYQMNGGFGAQGMDMNMMNTGMGGYGAGVGSAENWNGPQSWNNGQDNYNHPNASGMGNGDYGPVNSGYHTSYNQGNFGHQNQYNDYRGRGFRGRGFRGRYNPNYGRGGYGYGQNGIFQGQDYVPQQQYPSNTPGQFANGPQSAMSASGEGAVTKQVDEFGRTLRPETSHGEAGDADQAEGTTAVNENGEQESKPEDASGETRPNGPEPDDKIGQQSTDGATQPIAVAGDSVHAPNGDTFSADPSVRSSGPYYGGNQIHQRGGSFGGMPPPAAPDVPLNAPKGPKAMRQGLPNTSLLSLKARGYQIPDDRTQSPSNHSGAGFPSPTTNDHHRSRSVSPDALKRRDPERHRERSKTRDKEKDKGRDRSRERERRGRERSASRSTTIRSRSQEYKDKDRRRKRHRSQSVSDDEREDDRHRRRQRKKYSDDEVDSKPRSRDEKYEERSRSISPDRKSSHRSSRKDRDSEKRRDRDGHRDKDRDRDSEYDHRRKSTHRSHRDRDYDRERDRDRDRKDRDKDRPRDKNRDRDKESRHRNKRSDAEPPTPTEKDFNPPSGPKGGSSSSKGLEIRGVSSKHRETTDSSRRSSQSSSMKPTTSGPAGMDAHAAEREARNRERLLKDAQKLAARMGTKRRGEDGGEDAKRSRRKVGRGDVVTVDDKEARMKRLEEEREGSRWTG